MKIYEKLLEIQKKNLTILKDSINPHFKNEYASLESVNEYIRPILSEKGLLIYHGNSNGLLITTIVDVETGDKVTSDFPINTVDSQKAGGSMTYGKRYNTCALLNISIEDEDNDGNTATGVSTAQAEKKYPKSETDALLEVMLNSETMEALKDNYTNLYKLAKTEKQKSYFTAMKEKRKKELDI